MSGIARLTLTEFRSYPALTWRPAARLAVITGPNGSGKTNLLEAVSLLVPGRGLRGARVAELARQGPGASCSSGPLPCRRLRQDARHRMGFAADTAGWLGAAGCR